MSQPQGENTGPSVEIGQQTDQEPQQQVDSQPQQDTENPAWKPVWEQFEKHPTLNGFAPRIKEVLTPVFKQWDQDRQKLTEQQAPWKPIFDAGIPAERAINGLRLYELMETKPEIVYGWLKNNPALAEVIKQDMAAARQASQTPEPDPDSEEESPQQPDPTVAALQEQVQQMQFEQRKAQITSELQTGMNQLEEFHKQGQLSWVPFNHAAIGVYLKEQMFDAQQAGKPFKPDLGAAYQRWASQVASLSTLQRTGAPRITPTTSGGSALPLETDDGRIKPEVAGARQSVFNDTAKSWLRGRAGSGS